MVSVKRIDDNTFEVTVKKPAATTHQVSLSDEYHKKLAGDAASKEKLIEKSFEFLLERESNTSILREFGLPVIQHYFPEYEKDIKTRLQ